MGVDVVDVGGRQPGVGEGAAHGALQSLVLGQLASEVVGVARRTVSAHLAVDPRPPRQRVLELLEDHDTGPFAHDESVAILVEGPRRGFRTVVPRGKRRHVGEAANRHCGHRGLRAAADDDVRIAILDGAERIAYRVGARGVRRDRGVIRPARVELHRDHAGRDIRNEHRDEERADLAGPSLPIRIMLLLEALQPSDAAADDDAQAIHVVRTARETRVRHRLDGGRDRVLRVRVRALRLFPLHRPERIESLQFTGESHGKRGGIELRDCRRARDTVLQGTPRRRHVVPDRRYGTETRDDDPTSHYAPTLLSR